MVQVYGDILGIVSVTLTGVHSDHSRHRGGGYGRSERSRVLGKNHCDNGIHVILKLYRGNIGVVEVIGIVTICTWLKIKIMREDIHLPISIE